ncbi:MAG: hypothetical protein B6245_21680 [Desulfobacteraceae bacterium 4572_88]|nr:MAG: hypothetical protein B6245_21680 [Desulfobacteraceae bacterium 4572_88]
MKSDLGQCKVLLVDDVDSNIDILVQALRGDYRLAAALDGETATEYAQKYFPDLVLLDVMMPEMDGYEVCRRLQSDPATRDIPVIFLSARGEVSDKTSGFEAGAVDYITKPFDIAEVKARIRTHLSLKLARQAQKEAMKVAEAASKAKSDFLASMSHEIRTPMNAIIGMTDLTLQTAIDEEQKDNLFIVKDSAQHLLEIINDILDFSKMEAGGVMLDQADFDLHHALHSVVRTFTVLAERKGVTLQLDQAADVPRYLRSDPVRLRQILVNLIGNAIKFTERGGIMLTVTNETETGGTPFQICFAVSDTGIGIPKDKLDTIFKSFSQADGSTTRKYGGSGLGLAISKQLAELMGGSIRVQSQPGKGSTFSFQSAFAPGDADKAQNEKQQENVSASGLMLQPMNILLAEDNLMNARVAVKFLERLGHTPATASNGRHALDVLSESSFDLILMDIEMPEMDGLEATQRIRRGEAGEENRRVPIIAMTAHALPEVRDECMAAGVDDIVTKPVDFYDLNTIIRRNISESVSIISASREKKMARAAEDAVIIDRKEVLRRFGGDESCLREIFDVFAEEIPLVEKKLARAIENNDMEDVRLRAHSFRGSCGLVGAKSCEKLVSKLEQAAKEGEADEAREIFEAMRQELKKVSALLVP